MFLFYKFILLNCLIFTYILGVPGNNNFLVKEWKCVNRQCTEPISKAEAIASYKQPDHKLKLKFNHLDKLSVLRKPFDDKGDHWWIRLDESHENLEGYANKNFIRETKVFAKINSLVKVSENDLNQNSSSISPTSPNEVIVDGTTIYDYVEEPNSYDNQPTDNVGLLPDNNVSNITDSDEEDNVKIEVEEEQDSTVLEKTVTQYEQPPVLEESIKSSDTGNSSSKIDLELSDNSSSNELNSPSTSETKPVVSVEVNSNPLSNGDVVKESLSTPTPTTFEDSRGQLLNKQTSVNETMVQDLQNIGNIDENVSQNDILSTPESFLDTNSSLNLNQTETQADISSNSESSPSPLHTSSEISNTSSDENTNQPDLQPLNANINNENTLTESHVIETETNTLLPDNRANEINTSIDSALFQDINVIKGESEKYSSSKEQVSNISFDTNSPSNDVKPEYHATSDSISVESEVEEAFIEEKTEQVSENNSSQPEENVKSEVNISNNNVNLDDTSPHDGSVETNDHGDSIYAEVENLSNSLTTEANAIDASQNEKPLNLSQESEKPNDIPIETSTETLLQQSSLENTFPVEVPNYKSEDVTDPIEVAENESSESAPLKDNESSEEPKATEQNLIKETFEHSSPHLFSSIYSIMGSLKELFISTFGSKTSDIDTASEEIVEPYRNTSPEQCDEQSSDEYCVKKTVGGSLTSSLQVSEPIPDTILPELNSNFDNNNNNNKWPSFKSMFWIIISSHVILCFSLGYYYLDNWKRDCELVRKNNILAGDLFVVEREKTILEEELAALKEDMQKIMEEKTIIDNEIDSIKEELRKTKEEKQIVEEKEMKLVKKLKMIEQNYNELRKVFSETKQKGDRLALISDIKKLKESIAEYDVEISSLKEELTDKKNEIKQLNINLQKSNDAKMALQERFDKLVLEGQEIAKGYQETLAKMEQTIEENKNVQSSLEKDLRKHKKKCESIEIEKELAESALQKAHGITSVESLADWLEAKKVRSSLLAAEKEISKLSVERDSLVQRLDSVEEKCKSLTSEVIQLTTKYENSEKEKIDALTKLEVLSDHFEAKERKIQEEFAMREVEWLQKQSDENTIFQQLLDLREENSTLKNMVESLKKEMVDQEASYKKIINTTEQKAHENWVTFRRTEIRLKEVQAEAAQLRNRLASLEVSDDNSEEKLNKVGLEVNGDLPPIGSAMSPPFMLCTNEFIPPPPLVQLPPGANPTSRPPPLGRISSPPLVSGDFIPPPPLIPPYDVYPHVHQNPPSPSHIPPPLLHKPQPREHHHHHMGQSAQITPPRRQKDSQSSNQSSDSPHDKTPARRNKR
uniref:Transport and Golgi organization protein 1 n=1 Tax=Pristhesancus plagipennis TaxID=1955184 RepID=A0A2K8JMY5_PRIPG|nr:secreted hypothetical protein [Pristhesancus plagipennis]